MKQYLLKLIMNISKYSLYLFIIQVASMQFVIANNTYGQSLSEVMVSISVKKASFEEIISIIENQTNFVFAAKGRNIGDNSRIDMDLGKSNLKFVLEKLSKEFRYNFKRVNQNIYIRKQAKSHVHDKDIHLSLWDREISGKVTDENGGGLPGVNVVVKDLNIGTITDSEGNYKLNIPDNSVVLVFSYVGYLSEEVSVANQSTIDMILTPDISTLSEVVVIGYGTVKKSDLTGAVSSVKASELPVASSPNIQSLLSGKVAGLTVNQNSAQPGGSFKVLIRGAASTGAGNGPLFIVDGFPVSGGGTEAGGGTYNPGSRGSLNSLNTHDIESIEVLKDASATAIYGARAANGVVLITTKRGKNGQFDVSYSGSYAVNNAEKEFDFLNARDLMIEKTRAQREKWLFDNNIAPYGTTDIGSVAPFVAPFTDAEINAAGDGTDWFNEITETGKTQDHNISISSGNESTKYLMSFNYYDQEGIVKNTGFQRYTGRLNLDQKLTDWLDLAVSFTASHIDNENSQLGGARNDASGIIASAYQFPSFLPVKDDNGNFVLNLDRPNIPNPVSLLDIDDQTTSNRILSNTKLTAKIVDGLEAIVSIGVDSKNAKRVTYLPKTTLYGNLANGRASQSEERNSSVLFESVLMYTKQVLPSLNLNALGGFSYQTFKNEGFSASNSDFLTDLFLYNNLGAGIAERPGVGSFRGASKLVSYFGRLNLNYLDKYLLTVSMRADGSDRFGANNKYGYFPSAALAWKMHEEEFLKNQNFLSELKLRVSYGQTGNSNIGGNAFALFKTGSNYVFGNSISTGVFPSQLENPDLKWETTAELNIGLDFGLFGHRISGTFEYFQKEVSDILSSRGLPSFSPVGSIAANIGTTESKGVELLIKSVNLEKGKLKWNTDLTLGRFQDHWKERNPEVILSIFRTETDNIHSIFGYLSDGIVQIGQDTPHLPNAVPGDLNILDVNGQDAEGNLTGAPDGKIDDADRVLLGNNQPGLTFGINNTLEYGNFDLSIYAYGELNRDRFNDTRSSFTRIDVNNAIEETKERWASDNTGGTLPSGITTNFLGSASDLFIEDASFLRLRNVTFGYSLPNLVKGIKSVRVYVDLQNLFVLSNYTGGDPETDSFSAYPYPKTYKVGINVNF